MTKFEILEKETVAEKYLDVLETAVSITEFCGHEIQGYRTMEKIEEENKGTWFRVYFALQYGPNCNEPIHCLSTTIQLNDDNTSIASAEVYNHLGHYEGGIDKMSECFEGYADTTNTYTSFYPNANGELEVKTIVCKHQGHTNKGIDYDSKTEKPTEVYEFDGNWKNISPEMKKISPMTKSHVTK